MRVLFNTKPLTLYGKTGVGYYVFNLYRELLKSGIDVVPTLDDRSRALVNFLSRASSLIRMRIAKWYPSFVSDIGNSLIRTLSQKEDRSHFDIYHETSIDPLPGVSAVTVCNLYDLSFMSCPEYLTKDFLDYASEHVTKNVSAVRRIIVNTQFIKNEAVHFLNVPEEKIDVIPLAPSTRCKVGEIAPHTAGVRRFTEKDYLLYVGTIEPRKNLKTLIKAFYDVRRKYDLVLIIAGRLGWLSDEIISYPEELGIKEAVIFTHYVDEKTLFSLYKGASVFVYPSLYEGFGLPPLEAMACGIPVIISDIPPLREISGNSAVIFNPGDYEDLAYKINTVLSSGALISELREKGLRKAAEYSWENVAALTIQTYAKALEK
jgi:glycosyltransferase involved in cell wall biosynthesis